MNVDHTVAYDLHHAFAVRLLNRNLHNARVLYLHSHFGSDDTAIFREQLTRKGRDNVLGGSFSHEPLSDAELFIIFITSET